MRIMQRRIHYFAIFILIECLLFTCGCSSSNILANSNQDKEAAGKDLASSNSGSLEYLSDRAETDGYSSANGYYRIITRENATANLCYIDFATNKEIYLCNQPNCSHDSESCTSFIPFSNGVMLPVPISDKIVLLHGGNPSYAEFLGSDALAKIELLNADGSERHTIAEFAPTEQISQLPRGGMARNDRYVYFVLTDTISNERKLYRADIQTETAEFVYLFDKDEERIVGCIGDDIVISFTAGANNLTLDPEQLETQVFRLNPSTKEEVPLFSYSFTSQAACDGNLYAVLSSNGTIQSYDLKTGKTLSQNSLITPIDFSTAKFYGCFDGNFLIAAYETPKELTDEFNTSAYAPTYYAIDIRTGEQKELPYIYYTTYGSGNETFTKGDVSFIAAETDNEYMCCNGMNPTIVEFPKNDGTTVELPYNIPSYAMVKKDDFWNGVGVFTPIERIQ